MADTPTNAELASEVVGAVAAVRSAQGTVEQAATLLASHLGDPKAHGAETKANILATVPKPVWDGKNLGFKNDDNSLSVPSVDLSGPVGPKGDPGLTPSHQWDGTKLKFQNPDGTWPAAGTDLKSDSTAEAQQAATVATGAAERAESSELSVAANADIATQKATVASTAADTATTKAQEAATSATASATSATAAATSAQNAAKSAADSATNATLTAASVDAVTVQAGKAKTQADRAQTEADAAASSAEAAANSATGISGMTNVKWFGAKCDGVTNDAPAVQAAIDSGAKCILFPEGTYLFHSDSVATGEGACVVLTAVHSGVSFFGHNATIKSSTNKLQLFCIDGANGVSFTGLIFDNTLNGTLQGQVNPGGNGVPDMGIGGNGNSANSAISLFSGSDLAVTNCKFKSFTLGVYYVSDYSDGTTLSGHFKSIGNEFRGCAFCNLVNTPESYEVSGCRSYNTIGSIDADTTFNPGHLLYVTDRGSAVPYNGVVSDCHDRGSLSSCIKVRKGLNVAISNIVSYGSTRGLELVNIQEGAVINCAITLAAGPATSDSAIEITDCGAIVVTGCMLDVRNVNSWGFRIRKDLNNAAYQNKGWSISNCSILSDFTLYTGKAGVIIDNQSHYTVRNLKHIVEGSTKNTKYFVDVRGSSYGVIDGLSGTYINASTSGDMVGLDALSSNNTVTLDLSALTNSTDPVIYGDSGTNNNISKRSIGPGSSTSPSLSFVGNAGTGLYYAGSNVLGFASNGTASFAISSTGVNPLTDNTQSCGSSANRWATVYAGTGTINTSDGREKQHIEYYPDEVLDAWGDVQIRQFLFNDAVEKKGNSARIHAGVIAQQIIDAFERHGLDATRYALLCYDKWEDEYDDAGQVLITPAGERYGIRYEEALCIEAAYQRRRSDRIETRLETIENKLAAARI